jgi:hypothetical protein
LDYFSHGARTQSNDFDLQRRSCKFLQRTGSPARFENKYIFSSLKNALAYYSTGAVAVNSIGVGLAPVMYQF